MTEAAIKRCVPCQATVQQTTYEPLKMTPLPEALWCELSTDFYGPLPSGEYLLVIIDDYSRFLVIELVRSTSANTVIPVLDKVLSTFSTPDILKSDNGAPFNTGQFHQYAENMGFKHRKVTPYWQYIGHIYKGQSGMFHEKSWQSHENVDIRRKTMEASAQQVSEKLSCDSTHLD